jgi:dethiobiotin synthetase
MSAYFITATGTGIGKTLVTAALAYQLGAQGRQVNAIKPLVTGYSPETARESDPAVLLGALGRAPDAAAIAAIAPYRFAAPLAPAMAAKREGRAVDLPALADFCRRERHSDTILLIEGVGGVMVPLGGTHTVLDWIVAAGAPAILVTGSYLGTLSHTLTAIEVLRRRGVTLAGLVVSATADSGVSLAETANLLRELTQAQVIEVPRIAGPEAWRRVPDLTALVAG